MRNNTCIICNIEFEPREGKLYCSNSCKQKAFTDKKGQLGIAMVREQEKEATRKKMNLNFLEYQQYLKKYPNGLDTFQMYCFFRKNLAGNPTIEQINSYIKSFTGDWWEEFWENGSPARKRYKEFEEKFWGDESVVSFEKNNSEAC